MSKGDKKGSLEKGAGCEQREQTEGLKGQAQSIQIPYNSAKSLRLALRGPPPFTREAMAKMTEGLFRLPLQGSQGRYDCILNSLKRPKALVFVSALCRGVFGMYYCFR